MINLVDPSTGELRPEALVQQYCLCLQHSEPGTLYFRCEGCTNLVECPIYGTSGYAKRQLPFCPYFEPEEAKT